ncbi:MAG: UDP-N-acetylglucosamine 1-carboxyvinyltransferase, partial [Bacteroidales bacterium]|nr:UDP-N-acetylglucosamine 1-carboxyvinyltransferase [Bacteroidales bacterium]
MSSFIVEGGHRLSGSIAPQGAKNEALEVISAVLLTSGSVTISNIPDILDIRNLISLLEGMGVKVERHSKGEYTFTASRINEFYVSSAEFVEKCARLRGSVMVVGPLLARFGLAYFPKPGGDKIGRRRVDTHLDGFIKLGADCSYDTSRHAYKLSAQGPLQGCYMLLDEASVTGTANIVMAATLAKGTTTI